MKYINFLILGVLIFASVLLKDSISISTNLLSLFASKDSIEKLSIANELGYSKEMFVAVKGFRRESKRNVKAIAKKLAKLENIALVTSTILPQKELQKYYKDYYGVLADFDAKKYSREEVNRALKELYEKQVTSVVYSPINVNDPLNLFSMSKTKSTSHKGKYVTLGDYGYLIKATTKVAPSQMSEARALYDDVHEILKEYPDVTAFAPFFYSVENSSKIKGDVKWIVVLSTIILLLIYFVMLRDIKLLSHTFVALASSMLFATLVCTTTIENFGVLSLAFGTSLTAVSIDYFFHYYFHNFYANAKKFDRSVLYGFMTTVAAFLVLSFIPVPMISQISVFALLSLSFAYMLFTFVFKHIDIKEVKTKPEPKRDFKKVPALMVTFASLVLLVYSVNSFRFDENVKNLDYQNVKLQTAQKLFEQTNATKHYPVIVGAESEAELLSRLHTLKNSQETSFSFANFVVEKEICETKVKKLNNYDFTSLNALVNEEAFKIGFKKNYFGNAYGFTKETPRCEGINVETFKSLNLSIYESKDILYTIALVQNKEKALEASYVSSIDVKEMFARVANQMLHEIVLYSSIVLIVILSVLLFSVRRRFFYALNYILFPLSVTLCVVASFYEVNVMHLFSLIILIAIGIDYGIYMSNKEKQTQTALAIKYSLLSTFAAFGVLAFSSITALSSIGIVISLGVSSIYVLTKVMR